MPQPGLSKRPSARRGSSSAPDPFNVHADVNLDPSRSSTSTLTIVRVPSTDEPGSPVLAHRKSLQRKFPPPGAPAADSPTRLSFAFSSFSTHNQSARLPSPTSPSSSPRLRPSSPHLSANFPTGKPRLSPDQIIDLARQAANPTHTSSSHVFTPLPDDVYLPFLDRPAEVAALIASPPDLKLFALLAQTFPPQAHPPPQSVEFPRDPTTWSYHHLIHHLTKIDRDLAPDFLWSIAARKCVLSHSEMIWERIKGALGIPPELDVDYEFLEDDQASPDGSEDGDVHEERDDTWEEAVLDSPVITKLSTRFPVVRDHDDHSERKLPISRDFAYSDSFPSSSDDIQISIEPLVASSDVTNPHPPSAPTSALGDGPGLGDIAEGEEEEEEEAEESKNNANAPDAPSDPFDSVLPSQIQGLRISTTPLSSSTINSTPPLTATGVIAPTSSAPATAHSRTSSISSLVGPFNRSESTGTLSSLWIASSQAGVFFSGSDAGDSYEKESDKDKIQGMGPMFPGNFARLGGLGRSTSSSSLTKKSTRLPHTRYIASGVGIPLPPSAKEKSRAFSHTGGQRPFVQPAQRRRSWGAGQGVGMSSLSGLTDG